MDTTRVRRWRPDPLLAYAGGVGALGVAVTAAAVARGASRGLLTTESFSVVALVAALVLGELIDISIPRGDGTATRVSFSTVFAIALVVVAPLPIALGTILLAVVADDLRTRRRPLQVLFNAGQYALSMAAARLVFSALSGTPVMTRGTHLHGSDVLAAVAAGLAFSALNEALVAVVVALSSGQRVVATIADDARFTMLASVVLVSLGPVAAVLVQASVGTVPLLVLPILAVARMSRRATAREQASLRDGLTGLPNRQLLTLHLDRALAQRAEVTVLVLGLDRFKDVNDALGHGIGDQVLQLVAGRITALCEALEADAEVAHVGGDEFAVLLQGELSRERAARLADALLRAFTQPLEVQGTRLSVQTSIGIASASGAAAEDGRSAMTRADIALHDAKEERARWVAYDPDRDSGSSERVRLLPQLHEAVGAGQLAVVYQPQVDATTGAVVSVEALVRWDHPTRGRLTPDTFIDLAESSGLIVPITTFVLEQALAAAVTWERRGSPIGVSVNLCARQLSDEALPDHVAALISRSGAPASRLTVEVTESSLMDDPRTAAAVLRSLREMGVRLSIDDFGTGYSSLVLLQQLAVDELKVDRSFVQRMVTDAHNAVLVRSTIELAHNLGLSVVAEGVEDAGTTERLRAMGADLLQGYAFGRPTEAGAITELLAAQRAARRLSGTA